MENLKRPRYQGYVFKILEVLATKADSGVLSRPVLQKELGIKKSSMSDVLKQMASQGVIQRLPTFTKEERIEITDKGRDTYRASIAERLQSPIPYPVKQYLDRRSPKTTNLFPIQKDFVERGLLHTNKNCFVFGYPGSGKTLIAEMAMAEELENRGKILYCTPYKALDWQKYEDFSENFGKGLRVKVAITDGDNPLKQSELMEARIVIATYERVMGAIRAAEPWVDNITLVCADEITLLDDEGRGGTIDLILTHFRFHPKHPRLIALSSLTGNPLELSDWAEADAVIENRHLPGLDVKEWLVYRSKDSAVFRGRDGDKKVEKTDRGIIPFLIEQDLKKDETTLVFKGSRAGAQRSAMSLKKIHTYNERLAELANTFYQNEFWEKTKLTKELVDLIGYGIAFHHAGLQRKARRFVESLMKQGLLKTVIATTTLSHGVDYSIDNVIIELQGALSINQLHGYEYINLKGRTGRFGKSKNACVYLVTEEEEAGHSFVKYFQSLPEPVLPYSTFTKESVENIIMAEAAKHTITPQGIATLMSSTLCAKGGVIKLSAIKKDIKTLENHEFLQKINDSYVITELGKKINKINLTPTDAKLALGLSSSISDKDLLDCASQMDLAKKVRDRTSNFFTESDVPSILSDWISESSLDDIKEKHGPTFDDQDIMDLGEYTASALRKMSEFVIDKKFKHRLDCLQMRVKYGIKRDLANSGLMSLPVLSRDKKRGLARGLFDLGIANALTLSKIDPSSLSEKMHISQDIAKALIEDASSAA